MIKLSNDYRNVKDEQVRKALLSRTFKPLPPEEVTDSIVEFKPLQPPEPSEEYKVIVEKRVIDTKGRGNSGQETRRKRNPIAEAILWANGANLNKQLQKRDDTLQRIQKTVKAEREPKKRANHIKNAILWATDVSDPNAPSLSETAIIVARNIEKTIPKVQKAAKVGYKAAKTGIRAVEELAEQFEKTTVAKNLKAQAQADYKNMRAGQRRVKESVASTGKKSKPNVTTDKKRYPTLNKPNKTASSLNKPKEFPYGKKDTISVKKPQKKAQKTTKTKTQVPQAPPQANHTFSALVKKRTTRNPLGEKRITDNPIGTGIRQTAPFTVGRTPSVI